VNSIIHHVNLVPRSIKVLSRRFHASDQTLKTAFSSPNVCYEPMQGHQGLARATTRRIRGHSRHITLCSSRPRAVRWRGASAPRASHVRVSVWLAREGTRPAEQKNVSRTKVASARIDLTHSITVIRTTPTILAVTLHSGVPFNCPLEATRSSGPSPDLLAVGSRLRVEA
jgi:hypothetical protein